MDPADYGLEPEMVEMLRRLSPFPAGVEGLGEANISLSDEVDDRRMRILIESGYIDAPSMKTRGDGRVAWSLHRVRLTEKSRAFLRELAGGYPQPPPLIAERARRPRILQELAKRSGGDLHSFFAGLGYGQAYTRPGKAASKAKCIAEVITQAERDGRDDELIAAAIEHFDLLSQLASIAATPTPTRRLQAIPTTGASMSSSLATPTTAFIVHGRDPRNLHEVVARTIEVATTLKATILDEQLNKGRTLIDKFRAHATPDCLAIVVMTADDVGRLASEDADEPRPRQNVVLELGYFIALLPPERIIVLRDANVVGPSDVDGVVYYSLADSVWKHKLAREIAGLGVDVDFNKVT